MIDELKKYGDIKENVSLQDYNTYRIGGMAKYIIFPDSINDLVDILKILNDNNIKYFVLGNGSNVVLSSNFYDGAVIILKKLNGIDIDAENNRVYAEAGVMLPVLSMKTVKSGLMGLEFAYGIPGTIGGSILGNSSAYNSCLMDYVETVTVLDEDYDIKILKHEDIDYTYRSTVFKEKRNYIILAAKFYLKSGEKESSLEIIEERKKERELEEPLQYPSAGFVFRNPEGDYADRLIEACGLKGLRIGGAEVSEKHPNFIINKDGASSDDVFNLIKHVHDVVLEKTDVDLVIEQEFIGWE